MKLNAIALVSALATPAPPRCWTGPQMRRSQPLNPAGDRSGKRSRAKRIVGAKLVAIVVAGVMFGAFAAPIMAGAAGDQALAPTTDPVGTIFHAADRDGNGAIDGREAGAAGAWLFAEVDEDRDGGLSGSEMKTAPHRLTARPAWAEGRRLAGHMRDAGRYMDRDGDGWISLREFHRVAAYLYWMADSDRSGTLTRTELDSFLQRFVQTQSKLETHDR